MNRSSFAAVIVVSFVIWIVAVLHDFAQDKPLIPAEEHRTPELLVTNNTNVSSIIVITGKVHVVRDDASYRIQEVDVISDDGRVFKVLMEGAGKQLGKVLRSKIVRVTGEIREGTDKPLLVVNDMMVIRGTKKIDVAPSGNNEPSVKNLMVDTNSGNSTNSIRVNVVSTTNISASAEIKASANADSTVNPVPVPVTSQTNHVENL